MSYFSRRGFIKTATLASAAFAAAGVGLYSPRSMAAEFKLKFANNMHITHPMNARAREMAKAIREETNGAVQMQIFPSSQLGSDTDTLAQVRSGAVDMFALSPVILGTLVPAAQISAVGFAFENYEKVWSALDGELGAYVRGEIEKTETLFAFDKIWNNGFRVTTTSTRAVVKPEDLVGMKLRVPPSPIIMSMFRAFEAAPTSINFAEVYSALQTRIVEGQENPLTLVNSAKLYEVQKYCSLTNHAWDGFWMLGNAASFAKLPLDVQGVVRKHVDAAAAGQRADLAVMEKSIRETLKAKGLEVVDSAGALFRDKLRDAGYYRQWRENFGETGWKILESYSGTLS